MRILFVCHGNICRSPMAEFIFKALVKARGLDGRFHIESAAVSAEETGNPIYPPAKRCLTQHGVQFDKDKRARQVTRADYDRFDRIICMDTSNLRWIGRIIPEDPEGKIHLMMSCTGDARDVADPWYTGDFEQAFQDILEGCEAFLSSCQKPQQS
ncbi:MAG: low molecular weight phosphotyrosine protein phosphatase [Bacteroidales bacterium]|jgi:protein-tyrosine phosphatase|nr:low molecular weight phosphotyrosine protein phosphatase [Bacteroidales bacterium]